MSLSDPDLRKLSDAYRGVLDRITSAAARAKRDAKEITLVAVTKSASLDQIEGLLALGHRDLGENRVQQLEQRAREIASWQSAGDVPPRWHMIGHLQRNKVKQVAPLVTLIHSVDSLRLAEEINTFAGKRRAADAAQPAVDVLLQVNIAEEEQKYGLSAGDAPALAQQLAAMPHLRLRGLMTMAPYSDEPEESRPVFAQAAALFHTLRSGLRTPHFDRLSMGMSGDYEVAIEEGANVVRVGRALFE